MLGLRLGRVGVGCWGYGTISVGIIVGVGVGNRAGRIRVGVDFGVRPCLALSDF